MNSSNVIRILLVGHFTTIHRQSIEALNQDSDFAILGEAPLDAFGEMCSRLRPTLVIAGISGNAEQAAQWIDVVDYECPGTRTVVIDQAAETAPLGPRQLADTLRVIARGTASRRFGHFI